MNNYKLALIATLTLAAPLASAGEQVRVAWDKNPHSEAVIGFNNESGSYIRLGSTTNENNWQSHNTTVQRRFDGSSRLTSNFVRLSGLNPDSEYYFKICRNSCSSTLYYFKTAPNSPRNMTVVSGGDSRSSHSGRRQGNRLVAKIRPDYITFGGDYTNSNNASDMSTWLDHWQESFSVDQIDGKTFRRVYPIIPTLGNHEAGNPDTLCETFGTDPNGDGVCSSGDNYFAMNIGGSQSRVYTLNTENKNNATLWSRQKSWLINDLASQGGQVNWRLGQYHRSMVPTGGGKTSYSTIRQWAPIFEDGKMNLITESDTHIVKYTWPVVPSGSSYTKVDAGTVYIGEGSWGVGTRSTDTPQSWLADNASFKQFKIIQFNGNNIDIRTAIFSGETSTSTLTRAQRQANPLALPAGLQLWNPSGSIGEIYTLSKAPNNLTQVGSGGSTGGSNKLQNGVAKATTTTSTNSKVYYTLEVPTGATDLQFVIAGGSGDADMYVRYGANPTTSTYDCRPFKNGNAETCTIGSVQSGTYHVMLNAYSTFSGVSLTGSYSESGGGNTGGSASRSNLSGTSGEWLYYNVDIPTGMRTFTVDISSGSGDADLYVRQGSKPTTSSFNCRPYKEGNNESCSITGPDSGTWHVGILGYSAFSGLNLNVQWTP
ncbi:MAG: pre-peptidase C-terminal domain-containing protein [Algicola sp.]|nr:pre-peptidase C-terminal domain-containing protein [Algicola sp.]